MVSSVAQGSVLGPVLFIIYIDDITINLNSLASMFADDTKTIQQIRSQIDQLLLQADIDSLVDWTNKWEMSFNVAKCHVLHMGNNNPNYTYTMNGSKIEEVTEEKDIGVIVQKNGKVANNVLLQ